MQNLAQGHSEKKNQYNFVDYIRCIAIISIVVEHSMVLAPANYQAKSYTEELILSFIVQVAKFGTICFFILAGFLIGEKLNQYSPAQYIKRRMNSTLVPWLVWTTVFLLCLFIDDFIKIARFNNWEIPAEFYDKLLFQIRFVYIYSSFWFIPNFLICISLLLIFKKWLYKRWLGLFFLLVTLLYSVNVYSESIEPRHSTAILGFVFFFWLGVQINHNFARIERWINQTPIYLWIVLCAIMVGVGIKEAELLSTFHSVDPFNTLRISNIIYSLLVFILLLRIKNFNFIKLLKPRETSFGIYLVHFIIVICLMPMIFKQYHYSVEPLSFPLILGFLTLRFFMIYGMSFALVWLINQTKLRWIIGR